jgi:hypothetical protein
MIHASGDSASSDHALGACPRMGWVIQDFSFGRFADRRSLCFGAMQLQQVMHGAE